MRFVARAALAAVVIVSAVAGEARGGAPDISVSPASLALGPVLADELATGTLTISNEGGGVLQFGDITVDHPDFTVGGQSGGIPPGSTLLPQESVELEVGFRGEEAGITTAELRILTNDPDEPALAVPLTGEIVGPPRVAVEPDSLHESLEFEQSSERELTIRNEGVSGLDWSLTVAPSASAPAPGGQGPLAGVRILWDRSRQQVGTSAYSAIVSELESRGAVFEVNQDPIDEDRLSSFRIFWSLESGGSWAADERSTIARWMNNGGALILLGDRLESMSVFNSLLGQLGASFEYSIEPGSEDVVTTQIETHPATEGVESLYLGFGVRTLRDVEAPAATLVRDANGAPVAVAESLGAGRVVALSDEFFDDAAAVQLDNLRFGTAVVGWLAAGSWLEADVRAGALAAGEAAVVRLAFDTAGLNAGSYDQLLRVLSNDPVSPVLEVPVRLRVVGTSDISVPGEFDVGVASVGGSATVPLTVRNAGFELLEVTNVVAEGTVFDAVPTTFTVPGNDSTSVFVTFAPDSVGSFEGRLLIDSNDPVEPTVEVRLIGDGRVDCDAPCEGPRVEVADFEASVGFLFGLDVNLEGNPDPVGSFGFELEYDPSVLDFADSSDPGALIPDALFVDARENEPGRVTAGGIVDPESQGGIPAGASGSLLRLYFRVTCESCTLGTGSDLILGRLVDDIATMNACCGKFTLADCAAHGDVNGDQTLSPEDARCAMKIFLESQGVPEDCDVAGDCEAQSADVDCNGDVSPADALEIFLRHLEGGAPEACFSAGGGVRPRRGALAWGSPRGSETELTLPVAWGGALPSSFGLEIRFDPGALVFERMEPGPGRARGWLLEVVETGSGTLRLGGLHGPGTGDASGDLASLVFRPIPGAAPTRVTAVDVREAAFEGPRAVVLPGGGSALPFEGLEAVGPLPTDSELVIRYGISSASPAELHVHDVAGRHVRTLAPGPPRPGTHEVRWDGRDHQGRPVAAGIYFVRLSIGSRSWIRKAALVR